MAELYTSQGDQHRRVETTAPGASRPVVIPSETPVGVYERPERAARSGAIAGVILLVLVLLLLAYFVFQWWL